MDETLTWPEIEDRYTGEFVALADIESGPMQSIVRARLIWHGEDRDEGWERMNEVVSSHVAVIYVGPIYVDEEPVLML